MMIKGKYYKLKYTLRALLIFEQITGKKFNIENLTDEYIFLYSMLMANNPDSQLTFDELIDSIDDDFKIMKEFQDFLGKELERQNQILGNNPNDDSKKNF